jgi:hypothetical protein
MRPRSQSRKLLPPNLRERNGYYSWCDPRSGKELGLGRDKHDAIKQAREANAWLEGQSAGLVSRLANLQTIAKFIPTYRETLNKRGLAKNTLYHRNWELNAIEKNLGSVVIGPRQEDAVVITKAAADWLGTYEKANKLRSAKSLRSTLIDLFSDAGAKGLLSVNPIEIISLKPAKVKRERLTLEAFMAIYKLAPEGWEKRSMELGLISIQRLEDVANMGFRAAKNGLLEVVQKKTGARLKIPLSLRLNVLNMTLGDVISKCRQDGIFSQSLLHHRRCRGRAETGDRVHPQTISENFRECRIKAEITAPEGKNPPTFHEIRSLGIRLYKQQGYDPQTLAGHKEAETTDGYADPRGLWVEVPAFGTGSE